MNHIISIFEFYYNTQHKNTIFNLEYEDKTLYSI